jgi:electron transfer flavoprotein alpha/beta subunit
MNIAVCAKVCIDVSEIKIDSASKKPILQGIPKKISDIDTNAVEEATKNTRENNDTNRRPSGSKRKDTLSPCHGC